MKRHVLVLFLSFTSVSTLLAQSSSVELYRIKVVTVEGERWRGILNDVSNVDVLIGEDHQASPGFRYTESRIPLARIRKIILRRYSRRKSAIQGAILGGLAVGYVVVESTRRSQFRNPALYGLNLGLAIVGGGAAGALIGHSIGPITRKIIKPTGRDQGDTDENLRRQLLPFTYSYQNDVLNHTQP